MATKTRDNVRLTVSRDELMAACDAITPIISKKSPYEVIRNIHLSSGADGQPVLRGTNMDMEIVVDLADAEPQETAFAVLLPAERFAQFVRACKTDEYLEIRIGNGQVEGKGIRNEIVLQTEDHRKFPKSKDFSPADFWSIKASDLAMVLKRTVYAIDENQTKMNLGGVCLDFIGEALHGIATDTARMPHMVVPATRTGDPQFKPLDVILPLQGVRHLALLCGRADDDSLVNLAMDEGGRQIIAEFERIALVSKLATGPFPRWNFLDSKPYREIGKVKVIDFREAVSAVQITTAEESQGIRIKFEGALINLVSSSESGRSVSQCPMESTGDHLDVVLSGTYLMQCLGTLPGDSIITVSQCEPLQKTVRFTTEDGFIHNISPMDPGKQAVGGAST